MNLIFDSAHFLGQESFKSVLLENLVPSCSHHKVAEVFILGFFRHLKNKKAAVIDNFNLGDLRFLGFWAANADSLDVQVYLVLCEIYDTLLKEIPMFLVTQAKADYLKLLNTDHPMDLEGQSKFW